MADIKKVATRASYGEELVALGAERYAPRLRPSNPARTA